MCKLQVCYFTKIIAKAGEVVSENSMFGQHGGGDEVPGAGVS